MTDTIPPHVVSTIPLADADSVSINTVISATFSENINPATIDSTTFILDITQSGEQISSTIDVDEHTVTLAPSTTLMYDTSYTARLVSGITDMAGNALHDEYSWSFRTCDSSMIDTIPPHVVSTIPLADADSVSINTVISATFSENINPATIDSTTFILDITQSGEQISGTIDVDEHTVTLAPSTTLMYDTSYTARLMSQITDTAGNELRSEYSWSFNTIGRSSPDTGWSLRASGTSVYLTDVVWTGDGFIAVGITSTVVTSSDGISWRASQISVEDNYLASIAHCGDALMIVGWHQQSYQPRTFVSTDGISWIPAISFSDSSKTLIDVAHTGTHYIAVGGWGVAMESPDGLHWTRIIDLWDVSAFKAALWHDSKLFAVGYTRDYDDDLYPSPYRSVVYTYDLFTWSEVWRSGDLPCDTWLNDIIHTGDMFIAVGFGSTEYGGGSIITSTDGTAWKYRYPGQHTCHYSEVIHVSGVTYVAGSQGVVLRTDDFTSWEVCQTNTDEHLNAIAYGNSTIVVVGSNGTILTSPLR